MVSSFERTGLPSSSQLWLWVVIYLGYDNIKLRPGGWLASRMESQCSASAYVDWGPYRCRPPYGRDLVVLATYSCKPNTSAIPLCGRPTAHWEWRDGKSSVYTSCESARSGAGRWSTVLLVAHDPFTFWRIWVKIDIRRSRTCICRVVRKPQLGLIDSNCRAPRLWRLDPLTCIVVNQRKHGDLRIWVEKTWDV
jgi:hypothetical protein